MSLELIGMIATLDQSETRAAASGGSLVDREYVRRFARAHEDGGDECDGASEAWKIGKRRVGRERQHQQHRSNGEVVEPSVPHHRARQHGEHALVAGLFGVSGGDAVSAAEQRNARQQRGQQHNDDGEGSLGVGLSRLAEGRDAVGDGLDSGHGRAAAGEDFGEQP